MLFWKVSQVIPHYAVDVSTNRIISYGIYILVVLGKEKIKSKLTHWLGQILDSKWLTMGVHVPIPFF